MLIARSAATVLAEDTAQVSGTIWRQRGQMTTPVAAVCYNRHNNKAHCGSEGGLHTSHTLRRRRRVLRPSTLARSAPPPSLYT